MEKDNVTTDTVRVGKDINRSTGKGQNKEITDSQMLRGALKIEVSSSTPIVSAGTEFSIYAVIRNPFPVPVTIFSTETHIPVALSDENWRKIHRINLQLEFQKQLESNKDTDNNWQKFLRYAKYYMNDIKNRLSPPSGPRVAIAITPEEKADLPAIYGGVYISTQGAAYVGGSVNTEGGRFISRDSYELHFDGMTDEEIRKILYDINEYKQGRRPYILHPGDSLVMHFILKTTRWLTFTPIAHTFQIQVRYDVDDKAHVDTIPYSLNIRAPMASALVGAVLGSTLGAFVNNPSVSGNLPEMIRVTLTSVIFAIIIVVAFARQNNVQQVVSVEDFWGGVFIGFLVGYTGEAFISSVLGQPGN